MDYEKKYKEAIERAKEIIECSKSDTKEVRMVLSFFPELADSKDEKVKKSLIRLVKSFYDVNFPTPEGFTKEQLLSWLEKQGEQKSWSEEDEEIIHCLEYTVRHFYEDEDTINRCCGWLKSLIPQNRWKPSEEQIEAIANATALNEEQGQALYSLYNELKEIKD